MTAMTTTEPNLSALRDRLQQKTGATGLALAGDTTGIATVDQFFATRGVTLGSPRFQLSDESWPRTLTVDGAAPVRWTLLGLGADAVSTRLTLTFTQASHGGTIDGSFTTDGSVTAGQTVIPLTGTLGENNTQVFQLAAAVTLPLPSVGNFAFNNRFDGWLPTDQPIFTDMPFTEITVTAAYGSGGWAKCAVTTGVAGHWSLVQDGPRLTDVSVTLTGDTKITQGQSHTARSAAVQASLLIGGTPWDVIVALSGSSRVSIAIEAKDDHQPDLPAIAGLIAGDDAAKAVTDAIRALPLADLLLNSISIAFDWKQGKLLSADVTATLPFTFNKAPADFDLSISLPPLSLGGSLSPKTPVKIKDVISEYLGDATGFPDTAATVLDFSTIPSKGSYRFSLAMKDVFTVGPISLNDVSVEIAKDKAGTSGALAARVAIAGIDVAVAAAYSEGWAISGKTAHGQVIVVKDLISDIEDKFKVPCPEALSEFTLENVSIAIDTAKSQFTFGCTGNFSIADTALAVTVAIDIAKNSAGWHGEFDGTAVIGAATFKVTFKVDSKVKYLRAEFLPSSGALTLQDIAKTFGIDLSDVPAELLPELKEASFTYDFKKSQLVLTASLSSTTESDGGMAVTVVSVPDPKGRLYAAVVKIEIKADIAQLPVVGAQLAEIEDIGLDGASLVIASGVFTADEITAINAVIPTGQPTVPKLTAKGRVVLSADLTLEGKTAKTLQLAFGKPRSGAQTDLLTSAAATNSPAQAGTSSGQGKWINIQKSIGPITLSRVAVAYHDQLLWLKLDGGFAMGGIEIDLMGAAIGFRPAWPPMADGATLDGLYAGFTSDQVTIAGGLLKVVPESGVVEYDGQLMLKVPKFQLSVMGSYASLDGNPSLFAYGVIAAPIGGPPYLQVDGLAAGFGFNRDLIIPGLDKLEKMPLIAAVSGASPFAGKSASQALQVMHDYVPPSYGEYFLAAGVRVASCEMLKGFVLATGKLGSDFELALLGLASLSVPPDTSSPVAYAELVLEADFNFNRGTLLLGAQLTSNSFILSRDCHLTGGFVIAVWTQDDPGDPQGYKTGDFMVSLGGYHPAFDKPTWYPEVPRLGFNWNVTTELTLKGGLYFALVPSAVMAGGSLEAVWQSGDLRAWFNAWVDFLMGWKPFHYEAEIGVSLGASYKVDMGVTSFTVSVHVGVDVELWGPDFAGTATADLYVISISINFGASERVAVTPISWSEFKTSFLPDSATPTEVTNRVHQSGIGAAMPDSLPHPTTSICLTQVSDGMLQDLGGADGLNWVLDPERFHLSTWTSAPSKAASFTGAGSPQSVAAVNTDFDIGPMGVDSAHFASTHTVVIAKRDGELAADDIRVDVAPILTTLPAATWSRLAALEPSLAQLNDKAARTIANALTGLSISAKTDNPDVTPLPISLDTLRHDDGQKQRQVRWATPTVPTTTGYAGKPPMPTFSAALTNPAVATARADILAALAAQGVPVATSVDVSHLAASAADTLLSAPVLSVLGAEPQQHAA